MKAEAFSHEFFLLNTVFLYNNQKAKKGFLMTEQFILTSNDQQTQLNVRHWPCPSPKAVVQLIHGMAEHIQRYDEFARF